MKARESRPVPPAPPAADACGQGERGALTRAQLIAHATRIFATKGYAATSTREICQAAGANVAAIHYYFGDKAALYRATLVEPIRAVTAQLEGFDDPSLSFEQAMRRLLAPLVAVALDDDPAAPHVGRLHLREALEPSPVFREIVARVVAPQHEALVALLARHCGRSRPDVAIHQLAFAVIAIANDYCMSREYMKMLAPAVVAHRDAGREIVDRLVGYASALLAHEKARRAAESRGRSRPSTQRGSRPQGVGASR